MNRQVIMLGLGIVTLVLAYGPWVRQWQERRLSKKGLDDETTAHLTARTVNGLKVLALLLLLYNFLLLWRSP
ncbi:hypothetical protein PP175_06015 [Aneurinibacillus sp. Ricciae_BoGa-3]|uniref:hypothetical protein n=1 Tax=Aneurinibacillus sp. Ricciae_BoGa-3 TaxID=3022697 RepID=UPI00234056E4|nr:hypothetical protein [Aneurinibacillus sp. Ricciae_BoGa-3]WCK55504.1 hypothetical protein PP175_06015 [Aneurinibacillus sp. Ricciae_BoGa-3]